MPITVHCSRIFVKGKATSKGKKILLYLYIFFWLILFLMLPWPVYQITRAKNYINPEL